MKRLLAGAALALAMTGTAANATGYVQPQVPAPVIVEDTAASNQGIFVPIFAIALLLLLHHGGAEAQLTRSDAQLKTDIVRVGTTAEGIGIFEWRYIGDDQRYRGVLAQDVLAHRPDAVGLLPFGFYGVDYDALGMEMVAID